MKVDPVTAYAKAVTAGKIKAGAPVRLACRRHLDDLKRGAKRGLVWQPERVATVVGFFHDMLTFENGDPFDLQPWQVFVIGSLFGWYTKDGTRRFRTAFVEVGKGGGKTPMAAGIALYALVADGEPAPEVYTAATQREQARICFKDAVRMVGASSELKALIDNQVGSLSIPSQNAVLRPVSSEHRGLDGLRPHVAAIDELHEHPDAMVVDKIRAGTKTRRNALIFEITNSGYDRRTVCWQHHEFSLKVLEGVIPNDSWFAYVCALDEGDVWSNEKVWVKANPGLPALPGIKYLRELVEEAKGMPSKENIVRRLNFCEWTEQSERAIPMEWWTLGAAPVDAEALRGRACFGGLKVSPINDLSSFVLAFPPEEVGASWQVLAWYWVPEDDCPVRAKRDRVPYDVWAREGLIEATPGNGTDAGRIAAKVVDLAGLYQIKGISYNKNWAGEALQVMQQEGLEMVAASQTFLSMNAATSEFLRIVKGGALQHGGHEVLAWNVSNLATRSDAAGNVMPDQEHSLENIGGVVALIFALDRFLRAEGPEEDGPSIYETRGPIMAGQ